MCTPPGESCWNCIFRVSGTGGHPVGTQKESGGYRGSSLSTKSESGGQASVILDLAAAVVHIAKAWEDEREKHAI